MNLETDALIRNFKKLYKHNTYTHSLKKIQLHIL